MGEIVNFNKTKILILKVLDNVLIMYFFDPKFGGIGSYDLKKIQQKRN